MHIFSDESLFQNVSLHKLQMCAAYEINNYTSTIITPRPKLISLICNLFHVLSAHYLTFRFRRMHMKLTTDYSMSFLDLKNCRR